MAIIRIRNRRRDEQAIPDLCACCGETTRYRKTKQFSWYPPWVAVLLLVGLLPFIIVALILTKKRTLDLPLCRQHRHHFLWPPVIILGGFLLVIALVFALAGVAREFTAPGDDVTGFVCIGGVVGLLVWLVMALIVQSRVIKPKQITDDEIVLTGVAPGFVEEFADQLEARRVSRLDREVQEHWSGGGPQRARDEEDRGRDHYRREGDEEEDDRDRYSGRR